MAIINCPNRLGKTCGMVSIRFFLVCAVTVLCNASGLAQDDSDEGEWGHLSGQIMVEGEIPKAAALVVDKDKATCLKDQDEILDPSLVVGDDGGLKDVFVMMYFDRKDPKFPEIHQSYKETEEAKVVLDNNKCRFEPYAVFLRSSQTLVMKNSDDVGHNCHITLMKNEINANVPTFDQVEVQLSKWEKVPGIVKCDIHTWMNAVMLVRDEPYVAISDADGKFNIQNIPAGEWTFQFWHKRTANMKGLTKDGSKFVEKNGSVKVTITASETLDLGKLVIQADDLK